MNNFVIVIGRQYGAGGRRLGKRLAERLCVPYYDKELLSEAADFLGFSKEIFSRADEKKPSMLRSFLSFSYGATSEQDPLGTLSDERIYELQSRVIRKICEKGPCVIVGRTADYVMRDHPGLLSVFVHAPVDTRARAIVSRGEARTLSEAIDRARKHDRSRESYYNYFTNRRWGFADNYDLTVDSSRFGIEDTCAMLESALRRMTSGR